MKKYLLLVAICLTLSEQHTLAISIKMGHPYTSTEQFNSPKLLKNLKCYVTNPMVLTTSFSLSGDGMTFFLTVDPKALGNATVNCYKGKNGIWDYDPFHTWKFTVVH